MVFGVFWFCFWVTLPNPSKVFWLKNPDGKEIWSTSRNSVETHHPAICLFRFLEGGYPPTTIIERIYFWWYIARLEWQLGLFWGVPSTKYLAEGEKKTLNLTTGLSLLKLVELLASPWLSTIDQLLYMDVSRPGAHLNPIGFPTEQVISTFLPLREITTCGGRHMCHHPLKQTTMASQPTSPPNVLPPEIRPY